MRYSATTYKRFAACELFLGVIFLGTTGVQFIIDGNSKGAVGTVIGVVAIVAAVHMWMRAKQAEKQK